MSRISVTRVSRPSGTVWISLSLSVSLSLSLFLFHSRDTMVRKTKQRWGLSLFSRSVRAKLAGTERRRAYLPAVIASISSFCLVPCWPGSPNCLCFSSLHLRERILNVLEEMSSFFSSGAPYREPSKYFRFFLWFLSLFNLRNRCREFLQLLHILSI